MLSTREKKYQIQYQEISSYIIRRCVNRKHNSRPLELRYLFIAKKLGYSYHQVRHVMDKMVASGIIEKYHTWKEVTPNNWRQKNYYRRV